MPNPEAKHASDNAVHGNAVHGRPGDPCVFVIFGATGDLTKRLLIPSLYNLLANKLLPDKFAIIGVSNVKISSEDFRKQLGGESGQCTTTKLNPQLCTWLNHRLSSLSPAATAPPPHPRPNPH